MNMEIEIDRIAIHEAGHAVICLELGIEIDYVTIIPDVENGCKGCVHRKEKVVIDYNDKREENLILVIKEMKIKLGGDTALKKATNSETNEGALEDWGDAVSLVDGFYCDSELTFRLIKIYSSQVKKVIDLRWSHVEAIANELLEKKTLTGQEINNLLV